MNLIDKPITQTGEPDPDVMARIDSVDIEQWLHIYEQMLKIRYFEETVNDLYKTARMPGLAHLYSGEEAVAVVSFLGWRGKSLIARLFTRS
jgi:pyruvate dehydrogenase E1 component alpha subunit